MILINEINVGKCTSNRVCIEENFAIFSTICIRKQGWFNIYSRSYCKNSKIWYLYPDFMWKCFLIVLLENSKKCTYSLLAYCCFLFSSKQRSFFHIERYNILQTENTYSTTHIPVGYPNSGYKTTNYSPNFHTCCAD